MLDADLKRLLSELKLDAVAELLEKNEQKPEVSKEEIAPPPLLSQEIVIEKEEVIQVVEEAPVQIDEMKDEILLLHDKIDALAESLEMQTEEPKEIPVPKKSTFPSRYAFFLLIPLALFGFYFTGTNEKHEQQVICQADPIPEVVNEKSALFEKINNIAPDVGHAIKLLSNRLKKREMELSQITDSLSKVLYENAKKGFDHGVQEGALLMSRYEAINDRFAQKITQELALIESLAVKSDNPLLFHYFTELMNELGCQRYTIYQADLIRQFVKDERAYRACLDGIEKSETLQALQQNVTAARHSLDEIAATGFADHGISRKELTTAVGMALQRLQGRNHEEIEPLLQLIFTESGMGEDEVRYWEEAYLFSQNLNE